MAPLSRTFINPVIRAATTAISSPRKKSFVFSSKNFDLMTVGLLVSLSPS